jgi:hypothetical protein
MQDPSPGPLSFCVGGTQADEADMFRAAFVTAAARLSAKRLGRSRTAFIMHMESRHRPSIVDERDQAYANSVQTSYVLPSST